MYALIVFIAVYSSFLAGYRSFQFIHPDNNIAYHGSFFAAPHAAGDDGGVKEHILELQPAEERLVGSDFSL